MASAISTVIYRTPVFGWFIYDAVHGARDAKYYFAANLVAALILAIAYFGYPLVITLAVSAAAFMLLGILALTSYGTFWGLEARITPPQARSH